MKDSISCIAVGFFCILLLVTAAQETVELEWQAYKILHSKQYRLDEELARFTIWKMNAEIINEHNKLADEGVYSFWLKMNAFGDLVSLFRPSF